MDNLEEQIALALIKFGKMFSKASVIVEGIITAVDEVKFTCTVNIKTSNNGVDIDNPYSSIPLKVLKGSQASIIEIPAVKSACTIVFKDNNIQRPQLYQCDQCDKFLMKIGNADDGFQTLQVSKDGFIYNGGNNNGMVLLMKLLTAINRVEDKLKSHQHGYIPYPGGSAAPAVSTTPAAALIPPDNTLIFTDTAQNDLENTKIKQ